MDQPHCGGEARWGRAIHRRRADLIHRGCKAIKRSGVEDPCGTFRGMNRAVPSKGHWGMRGRGASENDISTVQEELMSMSFHKKAKDSIMRERE